MKEKRVKHIKTQVGALSGPDCGITEHGRKPALGQCYPVCVPPNVLRPLGRPLFDQEVLPKGCVRGGGFEILGPVKAGKDKGRYVMRRIRRKR